MTKIFHRNFLGIFWCFILPFLVYFSSMYLTGSDTVSKIVTFTVWIISGVYFGKLINNL